MNMARKLVHVRVETTLEALEIQMLIEQGRRLFQILLETPPARALQYLEDNPKLKAVVEKW
jgi:hypothetical protein